ncbi:MAG: DUF4364 domain-containing protein [Candidatus Bathyarchaeota archaeon]|nr:MAG: DUF4364 domain-containing protein [Candidatus Bathyarchaeota archaeon]
MAVGRRRDRHRIVADILNYATRGRKKTHIMYQAKLAYGQLSEYLPLLVEKGFLEGLNIKQGKHTTVIYKTTRKGIEFINRLESLNKLWDSREPAM